MPSLTAQGAATLPRVATPWRRLALLAAVVLPAHWWALSELAEQLQDFASSIDSPSIKRLDVAFVRELTPEAPVAAPLAPSPPVAASPRAATPVASAASAAADAQAAQAKRKEREARIAARRALQERQAQQAAAAAAAASAAAQARTADAKPTEAAAVADPSASAPTPTATDPPVAQAEPKASGSTSTIAAAVASTPNAPSTGQDAAPSSANPTASSGPPFEWPPSTRLSYVLTGNYQGEIHGSARVQWVRQADRYQVHMDVSVGPDFAPLMTRRMTSDGILGPQGLVPRRYDEQTRIAFSRRQVAVKFDDTRITLANGTERALPAGVQDSASQFVQLSYLFTLNPSLLKPGTTITLPVALPRRVDNWVYDVMTQETIATGIGDIVAYHVKPRRESPRPGELVAQAWFAPTLKYLPVRILITQEPDSVVDLVLKTKPALAAPE